MNKVMPIDISTGTTQAILYTGGGTNYIVQTLTGTLYMFHSLSDNDLGFSKSINLGVTWDAISIIKTGTCQAVSVWYDRWSGINAGLIHLAYTDQSTHDVFYRSIDTENSDTLSAETTIFNGASATASGSSLSLARMRGGNLVCGGCIDTGTELFCYKSTDVGGTWSSIAAVSEATQDQLIILPGWGADTNDAMCVFWDASVDEISSKLYDDSANSWSESLIASTMVDRATSNDFPQFSAVVDLTNSQNILIAWSAVDSANADLRCWTITQSTITEVTNVVLNSTDDQGMCALCIDAISNKLYAFYCGKSDGSEIYNGTVSIYYKFSLDLGTSWSSEFRLTTSQNNTRFLTSCPRFYSKPKIGYFNASTAKYIFLTTILSPHTTFQLGM